MSARSASAAESFRTAFCRRYGCSEVEFERAVLRRCFPPAARPLGWCALALRPSAFQRELALIRRLGAATDTTSVRGELDGYAYENQRDKSARTQTFGLRLSRRRFLRVWKESFGGSTAPAPGSQPETVANSASSNP